MRTIYKASITSVFLLLACSILPGIKSAHAACSYSYQPESLSAFSYINNKASPFQNILPVQNPPSIAQIIDFSLSSNCYPDSYKSTWLAWFPTISTDNGEIKLTVPNDANPTKLGTSGDKEKFHGFPEFNTTNNDPAPNQSTSYKEDSVINSVAKNGGYTINFSAKSTDTNPKIKIASTFVKATNCVALGGTGPLKIVFQRGNSWNSDIYEYLTMTLSAISFFQSVSPYKEYANKFSFFMDLKKITENFGPQDATGLYTDHSIISNLVNSNSSCGPGAYEYVVLAAPKGWPNEGQFLRGSGNVVLMNIPKQKANSNSNFPYVFLHESSHRIGNLSDEYKNGNFPRWQEVFVQLYIGVMGDSDGLSPRNNCTSDPINDFTYNNYRYGLPPSSKNKGCNLMGASLMGNSFYRASETSLMNNAITSTLDNRFNIVSCGYIISGILKEPTDKAYAQTHWNECVAMAGINKEGYMQLGLPPTISTLVNSVSGSLTMKGSGFSSTNNSIKLTTSPTSMSENSPSTLTATPHTFFGTISSFFGKVWSFFLNLIPYTHGQTVSANNKVYIIDSIPSDNTTNSSITFNIPTSTPNGTYSVAVSSANSNWNNTNFKITLINGVATVSGNSGNFGGAVSTYTDGAIVAATVSYTCPAPKPGGFTYNLVGNKCVPYGTLGTGGTGMKTVLICAAGKVAVGNICVAATSLTIAATLTYTCPTVPVAINGYYTLTTDLKCVFHFYAPTTVVTTPPVSTTIATTTIKTPLVVPIPTAPVTSIPATFIRYTCPSTNYTLSGTTCTEIRVACTTSLGSVCKPQVVSATPVYVCPTGYTLSGSMCNANIVGEEAVTTGVPAAKVQPTVTTPAQVSVAATVSYTCPSGSTLNGTSCQGADTVGIVANSTYTKSVSGLFGYVYSCASGYVLRGQRCYSTAVTITPASAVYSCTAGYTLNATTKMCVR